MVINTTIQQRSVKLDYIDKRIIYEFSQDCRFKKKQLAKQLKISNERLHYRIKKLSAIVQPALSINYPAFPFGMYILLIKHAPNSVYDSLEGNPNIYAAMQVSGSIDLFVIAITDDIDGFLEKHFSDMDLECYKVDEITLDDYNPWKLKITPLPTPKQKKFELTKHHYEALTLSIDNPTASAFELSKKTKYDYRTLKKYLSELHEHGYILKWRYQIDVFKLGFLVYMVKADLPPNFIKKAKAIEYEDNYSGIIYKAYNKLFFWYMPPSPAELHKFIENFKREIPKSQIEIYQVGQKYNMTTTPEFVKQFIKIQTSPQSKYSKG